jgi:hypothetical protein
MVRLLIPLILMSCASVQKNQVTSAGLEGTFQDRPYKTIGDRRDSSLLATFKSGDQKADSIHISISPAAELVLTYRDSSGVRTSTFQGRFSRKGYLEIFLTRRRVQIPPLIPLIYGSTQIYRLRIGVKAGGELVIRNKWVEEVNIFILGGGTRTNSEMHYAKLN